MSKKSQYVNPFSIKLTPVISTSAYTAGDMVGVPMQLTGVVRKSGQPVKLVGITGSERGGQAPVLSLFLFTEQPQPQTTAFADNAAPVFSSDTIKSAPTVAKIIASDWYVPSTMTPAFMSNCDLHMPVRIEDQNDPWLVIIAENAYDAVNLTDLVLTLHFERGDA